jgi:hypothetical protein
VPGLLTALPAESTTAYDSPLVCALAVLGAKEDGWKGPEQYPPRLSAVIKTAPLLYPSMVRRKGITITGENGNTKNSEGAPVPPSRSAPCLLAALPPIRKLSPVPNTILSSPTSYRPHHPIAVMLPSANGQPLQYWHGRWSQNEQPNVSFERPFIRCLDLVCDLFQPSHHRPSIPACIWDMPTQTPLPITGSKQACLRCVQISST